MENLREKHDWKARRSTKGTRRKSVPLGTEESSQHEKNFTDSNTVRRNQNLNALKR